MASSLSDLVFARAHHRRIAELLRSLDADLLCKHECLFGGGTLVALEHGEYRESRDVDFLTSSVAGYRALRGMVTSKGIECLFKKPVRVLREARMDQYGIRSAIEIDSTPIKFAIVLEGRIKLDPADPARTLAGVRTLSEDDLIAEKLLANSDSWADASTHGRDLIDLAMSLPDGKVPATAFGKASAAYSTIAEDVERAKAHLLYPGRLEAYMKAMLMTMRPDELRQRLGTIQISKLLPSKPEGC